MILEVPFLDSTAPVVYRCREMVAAGHPEPLRWVWREDGTTDTLRSLLEQRRAPVVRWWGEPGWRWAVLIGWDHNGAHWVFHDPLDGPYVRRRAGDWSRQWLGGRFAGGALFIPVPLDERKTISY